MCVCMIVATGEYFREGRNTTLFIRCWCIYANIACSRKRYIHVYSMQTHTDINRQTKNTLRYTNTGILTETGNTDKHTHTHTHTHPHTHTPTHTHPHTHESSSTFEAYAESKFSVNCTAAPFNILHNKSNLQEYKFDRNTTGAEGLCRRLQCMLHSVEKQTHAWLMPVPMPKPTTLHSVFIQSMPGGMLNMAHSSFHQDNNITTTTPASALWDVNNDDKW